MPSRELEILRDNLVGELNARQAATREAFTGALMQLVPAGVALGSWLKMRRELARTAAQFRDVVTQMQPDAQPAGDPAGYAYQEPYEEPHDEWVSGPLEEGDIPAEEAASPFAGDADDVSHDLESATGGLDDG